MYKQFYYSPFDVKLLDQTILDEREDFADKNKIAKSTCKICKPTVDWRSMNNKYVNKTMGCLKYKPSEVDPNLTVLVGSHGTNAGEEWVTGRGNGGVPFITPVDDEARIKSENLYITANTLAKCLFHEGLPLTHRLVRMLSCYGAGASSSKSPYLAEDFFARRLAIDMFYMGYRGIRVGGYTAETGRNRGKGPGTLVNYYHAANGSENWTSVANAYRPRDGQDIEFPKDTFLVWYDGYGKKCGKA